MERLQRSAASEEAGPDIDLRGKLEFCDEGRKDKKSKDKLLISKTAK